MNTARFLQSCLAVAALVAIGGHSKAITPSRLQALDLVVEDAGRRNGQRSLGRLSAYLERLRASGQRCELSTFAYGGTLVCERESRTVIIDLSAEPTRGPDSVRAIDIRPDGVNSKSVPPKDIPAFLVQFADDCLPR